jgi:hypothetical protein
MKVKSPPPDPELERQKAAAAQEKVNTIQERLTGDTDASLRRYGARAALAGASQPSMSTPNLSNLLLIKPK